jgi:hypothetical protein
MKRSNAVLKVVAILSSVLLVAGFVCYRAGAFNDLLGTMPTPATAGPNYDPYLYDGTSKSARIFIEPASQPPVAGTTPSRPTYLGGSKSRTVFDPAPAAQAPPQPMMGSSKSLAPLIPPSPNASGAQSAAPAQPSTPSK